MANFNNSHAESGRRSDNIHAQAALQRDNIHAQVEQKCELGILICKVCGQVIDTLPTNGVKKIYGVCSDADCKKINGGEKR